jgi:hypothetical protein
VVDYRVKAPDPPYESGARQRPAALTMALCGVHRPFGELI